MDPLIWFIGGRLQHYFTEQILIVIIRPSAAFLSLISLVLSSLTFGTVICYGSSFYSLSKSLVYYSIIFCLNLSNIGFLAAVAGCLFFSLMFLFVLCVSCYLYFYYSWDLFGRTDLFGTCLSLLGCRPVNNFLLINRAYIFDVLSKQLIKTFWITTFPFHDGTFLKLTTYGMISV